MIGQYLSNTNEIDTIHILQNILQVNKAQASYVRAQEGALAPSDGIDREPSSWTCGCM
jgi:hypothetical protein